MTSGGGPVTSRTPCSFRSGLSIRSCRQAILATKVAEEMGLDKVISFDMGGTTAKISLIGDYRPQTAREFEVDRAARFTKGSGLPLRIPVIEMVEIGAGGGSIAQLDSSVIPSDRTARARTRVPPPMAGAETPAITDADVASARSIPQVLRAARWRFIPRNPRRPSCGMSGRPSACRTC